jgi:proline dehydrogenase
VIARRVLLALADSERVQNLVTTAPGISSVVTRFAAGDTDEDALGTARELEQAGFAVSLDYLGEHTLDRHQADRTADAYVHILKRLEEVGLSRKAEVSVKLSAVGQALPADGIEIATANARRICEAASAAQTVVTLDMEDHTTTDNTLTTLHQLRADFPHTGAVLQAYLHRTAADCHDLSGAGSRVRLCKGAYNEPDSVALQDRHDVDLSYVRCMKILLGGEGHPMFATHDSRLIAIAEALIERYRKPPTSYEFQMLYGVRTQEQRRLLDAGRSFRVYVPYGTEWYAYLVRRMAERPANLALGLRAILDHR